LKINTSFVTSSLLITVVHIFKAVCRYFFNLKVKTKHKLNSKTKYWSVVKIKGLDLSDFRNNNILAKKLQACKIQKGLRNAKRICFWIAVRKCLKLSGSFGQTRQQAVTTSQPTTNQTAAVTDSLTSASQEPNPPLTVVSQQASECET